MNYFSSGKQSQRKLEQGQHFFENGNFVNAANLFKEAWNADNSNREVLRLLAISSFNARLFGDAIKASWEYLKFNDDDQIRIILGCGLYMQKNYEDTIKELQKVSPDSKEYLRAIQLIASSFADQGKYDMAIEVMKKAPLGKPVNNPELVVLHYTLAEIYEHSGDKQNALKQYQKVYAADVSYRDVADKLDILSKELNACK